MTELEIKLLDALRETAQTLSWISFGECRGISENLLTPKQAVDVAKSAIDAAEAAQPVAPGLYAILYHNNWHGEGDTYHQLAEFKGGHWYAEDSGKKLFQYEGDAILRVWPLSDDSALEVVGWEYLANDKWYRGVDNDRKSVEKFGYPIRLLYADSNRQTCRSKAADSELQKILMSESETQADGCDWHQEDESGECWSASCGALFSLYEGTPSANGMRFCHSCGKPLVEHKWQDDEASTVTQKGDEGVGAKSIQDAISHEN